jgi:hypothetical protein
MVFLPPPASARLLKGVPLDLTEDFAIEAKQRFDAKDHMPGNEDPSLCKALLKFTDAAPVPAVMWCAKMSIDTDGPSAGPGRRNGEDLDRRPDSNGNMTTSGTNATSLKFAAPPQWLPAETVPYIVLPSVAPNDRRPFDPLVRIGDLAVVVFKEKIAAAICGDIGPSNKIGEASIRVHEMLYQPAISHNNPCLDPCEMRDDNGYGIRTRNDSVGEDVLYFVFPGSRFEPFAQDQNMLPDYVTYATIETLVTERAFRLYNRLRGNANG